MSFCLPKFAADKFREGLKSGKLNPESLARMTSEQRRSAFTDMVGDMNGKQVNTLFEKQLLLKNQQTAMINWAKKLLDLKPDIQRDIMAKIERLGEVMQPKQLEMFLEDIVEQRLGVKVTASEAGKLADLAKRAQDSKQTIDRTSVDGSESRIKYGLDLVMFRKYVEGLKVAAQEKGVMDYLKNPGELGITIAGTAKSLKASLDNSFFLRQGMTTLLTHPGIWAKTFMKSWSQIGGELKGVDTIDLIKADIFSRENALNGNYAKLKLAIGLQGEEAFPESLPGKIPLFGRLFKASEAAYNGAALRMRADLADTILSKAEKKGVDITNAREMESIGELINDMTGRGKVTMTAGQSKFVNASIFSIRFFKSNLNTLLRPIDFRTKTTSFVRAEAAKNLMMVVGETALVLAVANQLWPGSVEWDPRSSDFGKIKIGNTRFDITGGKGAIITLMARTLVPTEHNGEWGLWSKSSVTGKMRNLISGGYGKQTAFDAIVDFASGKASPTARAMIDFWKGQDFNGQVPTFKSSLYNLTVPLGIANYQELEKSPNAANTAASMMAEALGIGVNTYNPK